MARRARGICSYALVLSLAAGAAAAAPPERPGPSQVLADADRRLGSQWVNFPQAPARTDADRTLAPYFHVAGDSDTERLPLKETSAKVDIAGVIARVQVRQVFENSGKNPIEAVYVFPASTRAAVHGMRMTIGSRTVEAHVDRRAKAREDYENARAAGQRASLLEQQRPNVFTMNVANILPGDRIEVALDYSELLVPENSVYEFVYPTVVGPRYGGGADPKTDGWIENPYVPEGGAEPYRFDIRAHLETGIALKEIASPSHKLDVKYASATSADATLAEPGGGNRDFVLRYRLAGDAVETGLLVHRDGKENFFLLQVEPPQRPAADLVPPREYVFLLDVSGSMMGFPLDTAKKLMNGLLSQMRAQDVFNVALFSGAAHVMHPRGSVPATKENVRRAMQVVDSQRGGGGTELMGGLDAVYSIPHPKGMSRTVVVVTDGYVGVEARTFKFVREHLDEANVFAFGIGSSVNRGLVEGMARAGQGEPFVVLGPEAAAGQAERFRAYVESPVLTGVEVRFPGFDTREVAPAKVPDLLARRPIVVFGKFRGEATGRVEVTGTTGRGAFRQELDVRTASSRSENAALRWLWARKWVATLDDEYMLGASPEIEEAITDLGLTYSLLTQFTSFVAVDSEIANPGGAQQKVKQPLPLPRGVSNNAVGDIGAMAMRRAQGAAGCKAAGAAHAGALMGLGAMGGSGRGAGGGGMVMAEAQAPVATAAPVPAAPPPPTSRPAPEPKPAKVEACKESASAADVRSRDDKDVGGDATIRRIVMRAVREVKKSCPVGAAALKLRLTMDADGHVTKIEVLSGDAFRGACLAAKLKDLKTGVKGGDRRTIEIVIGPDA